MKKILVYGYGNPGRQDDGLGVLLADKIDSWAKKNKLDTIFTDTNYQLNIEDAYGLNEYDHVIFADASITDMKNYLFEPVTVSIKPEFTMHSVSPGFVVGLCEEMYQKIPECYILHIKGYAWEFMLKPGKNAKKNLDDAFKFLTAHIKTHLFTY
jgi:hydrogenase maturation protease